MSSKAEQIQRILKAHGGLWGVASLLVLFNLAVGFRLFASSLGHNYDLRSYWIVSTVILSGENVYATTDRYNYGPIWAVIVAIVRGLTQATGEDTLERFHFFLAMLLSAVDLILALLLRKEFGVGAMLFFLFNPVSILITGYHSQFDNLAILFALVSWWRWKKCGTVRGSLEAGILMGISLSIKHLYLLFLPWVLFIRGFNFPRNRALFAITALLTFFAGFGAVGIGSEETFQAIGNNVFGYKSQEKGALLPLLIDLTIPAGWAKELIQGFQLKNIFCGLVGSLGLLCLLIRTWSVPPPVVYLATVVVFSSAMADQYLAIPIVLCAIAWRNLFSWCYCLVATNILLTSRHNIGSLLTTSGEELALRWGEGFRYEIAQVWLLFFLIYLCSCLLSEREPRGTPSLP